MLHCEEVFSLMHAIKTITQGSSTLSTKWQFSIGKITQILKYGLLMDRIMEAANYREGKVPLLDLPSVSCWERGESKRKRKNK